MDGKTKRELAIEVLGEIHQERRKLPRDNTSMTKSQLVTMAKVVWDLSYRHAKDDEEALNQFVDRAPSSDTFGGGGGLIAATMYLPQEQIQTMGLARWADQAFPIVQMGHKYFSALVATSVNEKQAEDIQPPWGAFLIQVPTKVLSIHDLQADCYREVTYILVHHVARGENSRKVWRYITIGEGGISLWKHGADPRHLLSGKLQGEDCSKTAFGVDVEDRDERLNMLIGRLVLNVCLAMSNKDNVKKVGKAHKYKGNIRTSDEPLTRVFQLGKPLKLDCRKALTDYIEGKSRKGSAPSVQTLVVGHWKMQAYGPKNSLRKHIHIEPYWRGPDDAPILVRPHELKEE